ncbi:hypothetical protein DFS33DRAFT_1454313 [Desarmillaria ectypa]|nr:hypothetical protein DFS33DRAFT_1454313 [Desarmillaria ectypa]
MFSYHASDSSSVITSTWLTVTVEEHLTRNNELAVRSSSLVTLVLRGGGVGVPRSPAPFLEARGARGGLILSRGMLGVEGKVADGDVGVESGMVWEPRALSHGTRPGTMIQDLGSTRIRGLSPVKREMGRELEDMIKARDGTTERIQWSQQVLSLPVSCGGNQSAGQGSQGKSKHAPDTNNLMVKRTSSSKELSRVTIRSGNLEVLSSVGPLLENPFRILAGYCAKSALSEIYVTRVVIYSYKTKYD